MISGIKRKSTAIEGTKRYFQTVDLIISHFKREADKGKIYEILETEDSTLKDLLIATAAVHIYHNLGIRVKDSLELSQISSNSTSTVEIMEKKSFFKEVKMLLKDSLKLEIDMLFKKIDLENRILRFAIEEREIKLQEFQKQRRLTEIGDQIEQDLMDIIMNYPPFYFFDLIGDLIGLTDQIKLEVLEEGSAFKDLSVEIEKKLKSEEKEDKFIELSTLNRIKSKTQKDFEFKSYTELQVQAMPVRMIKRKIIDYNLNRCPVSISGLKCYLEANETKRDLIKMIEETLNSEINYDDFEKKITDFLKNQLIEKLKSNPNDFIYFLENINESDFTEIIFQLNKNGIYNILDLINADNSVTEKIKKYMIRYNINKFDFIMLNDDKKNVYLKLKKAICKIEIPSIKRILRKCEDIEEFDLREILKRDREDFKEFWDIIEENLGLEINKIKEHVQKKRIIDKFFINELDLHSYSQILVLLEFDEILTKLVKETFYYLFSRMLRQLSRIIESYLKIANEKTLYLLALKKMQGTTESEEWVLIKLEELLINRIMKRQGELVVIFNAQNKPFEVNGFIYSRLTDRSLLEGISELKNEISPLYEEIKPIKLNEDIVSPISYCLAYDLIKRFETFEELRKLKVEERMESKARVEEQKREEIREKQKQNTFNWIERRITSSLMRINSPGINPNQLYWQEKDLKITTDNIKLHSELEGPPIELISDFFAFCIGKIKEFVPEMKFPEQEKINKLVKTILEKILEERLNHIPSEGEINTMLEGERFEASKQIATRIGKFLDKALYTKFKQKSRNG